MKPYLLSILTFILLLSGATAQTINDLVIFSNEGTKFYLILNGVRYNDVPDVRVAARNLDLATYQVRIIFENKSIPDHENHIYFHNTNKECVFALNRKNKKKYTLDYVSAKDIIPVENNDENNQTNNSNSSSPIENTTNNNNNNSTNTTSNTTTTIPNTTTNPTNNTTNSNTNSIAIKAGGLNIGMNQNGNINIGGKDGGVKMNTGDKSGNLSIGNGENAININKVASEPKTGCATPMSATDFETMKKSIASQNNDDSKMIAAKTLMESSCFTTSQVKEIMGLLSTDESKLEFAKAAYPKTHDLSKYNDLKDSFTNADKKKEFSEFVKKQK